MGPEAEERAALMEALLTALPDAVLVVGPTGRIVVASPAVEALFGWRPDELIGQTVEALIPEEVRDVHEAHRQAFAEQPAARAMGSGLDLHGRRRDGTSFPVDVSLAPVVIGGSQQVGAFVRDATERRRDGDLLRSVNDISRAVLAGEAATETLALTARRARSLCRAAVSWVVIPDDQQAFIVAAADGQGQDALLGARLSAETSLSARAIATNSPLFVEDMSSHSDVLAEARALHLGPGVYLPLGADDGSIGAMVVARPAGDVTFDESELRALAVFAAAASVVLSLGQARQALEELRLVSEYERIARDLHDSVIQRLFALGMALQGVQRLAQGAVAERISTSVDVVDQVIREIRETIFALNRPDVGGPDVRQQLRTLASEAARELGFEPRVGFRGPVEAAVNDAIVGQLVAVAREALSNVARHANAHTVEIVLAAAEGSVRLSVVDDGVGMPDGPSAGHGLSNMENRARQFGGNLRLMARRPTGTLVEWSVPSGAPKRSLPG